MEDNRVSVAWLNKSESKGQFLSTNPILMSPSFAVHDISLTVDSLKKPLHCPSSLDEDEDHFGKPILNWPVTKTCLTIFILTCTKRYLQNLKDFKIIWSSFGPVK